MLAINTAEQHELKNYEAAAVLREGVNTFSQAVSSQRKRKRGVSSLPRSSDDAIGTRLDIEDLDIIAGNSRLRTSLKGLVEDGNVEAPSAHKLRQKLSAPTPHAIQVRLNRQEAYSSTKQTLDKWLDAVKATRSAEQLIFPLERKPTSNLNSGKKISSHQAGQANVESSSKLEARISGTLSLVTQDSENNKSTQGSKNPTKSAGNHTQAKTAHLRMERELLLRKEAKAKRLRRIKSKSYRRLMRKDEQRVTKETLASEDAEIDEIEGALEGVERGGAGGKNGFRRDNSPPVAEESHDIGAPRNLDERALLRSRNDGNLPGQRLFAMKFMEEAEKRTIVRDKILEAPENQESPIGRRVFHDGLLLDRTEQTETVVTTTTTTKNQNGLSYNPESASLVRPESSQPAGNANPWLWPQSTNSNKPGALPSVAPESRRDKHQSSTPIQNRCNRHTASSASPSSLAQGSIRSSLAPQNPDKSSAYTPGGEQPELLARAFAGDNALPEIANEGVKYSSAPDRGAPGGLQGWGSWGASLRGAGKTRKQNGAGQQRSNNYQTRSDKVILNQKLCKKGAKYLATNLPYPFETGDQYERSLRFPIGQEWSTKQTHQTLTAPEVIVKGGTVITPLS